MDLRGVPAQGKILQIDVQARCPQYPMRQGWARLVLGRVNQDVSIARLGGRRERLALGYRSLHAGPSAVSNYLVLAGPRCNLTRLQDWVLWHFSTSYLTVSLYLLTLRPPCRCRLPGDFPSLKQAQLLGVTDALRGLEHFETHGDFKALAGQQFGDGQDLQAGAALSINPCLPKTSAGCPKAL